jgi:transposase, IS5 family
LAHGLPQPDQRKGARNKPLSECQQRRHQRIAKTRARVEHDRSNGWKVDSHDWPRASQLSDDDDGHLLQFFHLLQFKLLVYFQKAGIEAF